MSNECKLFFTLIHLTSKIFILGFPHQWTHCKILNQKLTTKCTVQNDHRADFWKIFQGSGVRILQRWYVMIRTMTRAWYAYYTRIPPDPMNHVQICKGQPHWFALWEPVPHWYKTFLPDHIDLAEMKNPAGLSKRISTAYSCAEDQILENKSSEQSFKYLYWTISKTLFWNMFTRKWT